MTVGGAFVYVCVRVKDFEQRWRVYNAVLYNAIRYNALFSRGPRRRRYNGVAVYHTEIKNLRRKMNYCVPEERRPCTCVLVSRRTQYNSVSARIQASTCREPDTSLYM